VALEGHRIAVPLGVPDGVLTHRGREGLVCKDLGDAGVEACDRGGTCSDVAHGGGLVILVDDPGGIRLAALHHRVLLHVVLDVGGAPERVVVEDGLDDGVEGVHVRNRSGQLPDGGLGVDGLDEICHFFRLPAPFHEAIYY